MKPTFRNAQRKTRLGFQDAGFLFLACWEEMLRMVASSLVAHNKQMRQSARRSLTETSDVFCLEKCPRLRRGSGVETRAEGWWGRSEEVGRRHRLFARSAWASNARSPSQNRP